MTKLRPPARQAPFANAADCYDFVFRDLHASKADALKPGFFNQHRSELIVGTMIEVRLGDPRDGVTVGTVQIIDCPRWVTADVLVSAGQFRKFTPVRHSGIDEEASASVAVEPVTEDQKGAAAL